MAQCLRAVTANKGNSVLALDSIDFIDQNKSLIEKLSPLSPKAFKVEGTTDEYI